LPEAITVGNAGIDPSASWHEPQSPEATVPHVGAFATRPFVKLPWQYETVHVANGPAPYVTGRVGAASPLYSSARGPPVAGSSVFAKLTFATPVWWLVV
jgi:hypothetical protein